MNHKKVIALCFLLILPGITGTLTAIKDSRIRLFVSTGVSFPVYPDRFAGEHKPAVNLGFGMELKLSPRLIVRESFNLYSYYPKEDYYKSIIIGGSEVELPGKGIYKGDHYFLSSDLWLDLKYILMEKGGFSYYVAAGGGVCLMSYVYGGYISIFGRETYRALALQALISGGIGVSYKVPGSITLFLEASYRYNFYKNPDLKRGTIPLRLGISTGI